MRAPRIAAALLALVLLPAAVAATTHAERHAAPPDFARLFHRAAERLALTPEQKGQVHGIFASHRGELRAEITGLRAAHKALFAAIATAAPDEGTIRAAARAAGQAHEELAVTHAHLAAELHRVLTREQLRQAHQLFAGLHTHVEAFLDALVSHLDAIPPSR